MPPNGLSARPAGPWRPAGSSVFSGAYAGTRPATVTLIRDGIRHARLIHDEKTSWTVQNARRTAPDAGGHGLGDINARRYERVVAEGGIALVVDAPDIIPAAQAEDVLREGGAVHVPFSWSVKRSPTSRHRRGACGARNVILNRHSVVHGRKAGKPETAPIGVIVDIEPDAGVSVVPRSKPAGTGIDALNDLYAVSV